MPMKAKLTNNLYFIEIIPLTQDFTHRPLPMRFINDTCTVSTRSQLTDFVCARLFCRINARWKQERTLSYLLI